jgi:hypothetical protein
MYACICVDWSAALERNALVDDESVLRLPQPASMYAYVPFSFLQQVLTVAPGFSTMVEACFRKRGKRCMNFNNEVYFDSFLWAIIFDPIHVTRILCALIDDRVNGC